VPRVDTPRLGMVIASRHGVYFEPPRWMGDRWHERLCSHCRGIERYFREQAGAHGQVTA
jgi:hypothetical protein